MNKEVRKYMGEIGKKGMDSFWKDKGDEERSKIMSERRIKGIKNKKDETIQ